MIQNLGDFRPEYSPVTPSFANKAAAPIKAGRRWVPGRRQDPSGTTHPLHPCFSTMRAQSPDMPSGDTQLEDIQEVTKDSICMVYGVLTEDMGKEGSLE